MKEVIINAGKAECSVQDLESIQVGQLMELLSRCDPESPIFFRFNGGYSYSGIGELMFLDGRTWSCAEAV